ncbi:histidine phosphatase family protein [Arsenicicoccus sp. oral taxon 190]|uniref:histidine phosphatase family protein n=1 Tax=Arsenicicoccus sp. oral taxon 190 TaxID=1658671 RepID=UPI00067A422C|nr:histidine phosphatase family protein [Arsenicicoccus sp. oral taxon 190]AKT52532.1 histidine phosphatase [Arsenicicoccus sp. oral taxon 190]
MRLILLRHGQTTSNVDGLLDTAVPGADLTERGHEQAAAVVEALADHPIDAIYVSDLVRTHQTAAPLAAALSLEPTEVGGLREISAGDVEMRGDRLAIRTYLDVLFAWARGELDAGMPGAETGHDVLARFDAAIEQVAASGAECAVVVSHGAVLRLWTAMRCDNLTGEFLADRLISNTGVVMLDGHPEQGWRCLLWEDEPVGGEEPGDVAADGPTA